MVADYITTTTTGGTVAIAIVSRIATIAGETVDTTMSYLTGIPAPDIPYRDLPMYRPGLSIELISVNASHLIIINGSALNLYMGEDREVYTVPWVDVSNVATLFAVEIDGEEIYVLANGIPAYDTSITFDEDCTLVKVVEKDGIRAEIVDLKDHHYLLKIAKTAVHPMSPKVELSLHIDVVIYLRVRLGVLNNGYRIQFECLFWSSAI